MGDWKVIDINSKKVRGVKCRFWWKLRPILSDWNASVWVEADPGEYIVYTFLEWRSFKDYVKPPYLDQQPIAAAEAAIEATKAGQ